jgi:diaminohydroxyphosphoribosylaminopyrimidine deaminase/5-amino-6-(5-phosphoribosylamino)uracil reductase
LCDAVLVGSGTVNADNPKLGTTKKYFNKNLKRIIIDSTLSLDIRKIIFRDKNVLVFTTELADKNRRNIFLKAGIDFKILGKKRIDIKKLLFYLAKGGIQSIYVESGADVHGAFYDAFLHDNQLIDKIIFYLAPKIIGGKGSLSSFGGEGIGKLINCPELKFTEIKNIGKDFKIEGYYNWY